MGNNEHRQIARDSLFVMAELRVDGLPGEHRVRVRNLSAGGMMAEGPLVVQRGQMITIKLRNLGWVEGSVAWVQDSRFGIAFRTEIDPKIARAPAISHDSDAELRRRLRAGAVNTGTTSGPLRKL